MNGNEMNRTFLHSEEWRSGMTFMSYRDIPSDVKLKKSYFYKNGMKGVHSQHGK